MRKKDFWLAICILGITLALCLTTFARKSIPTGSWGLSFRASGQTPAAPASPEALAELDGAFVGDAEEKVLYLTFDAGYENGCTAMILDVLEKHDVKAAFFLVGSYIRKHPDLVRRMVEEGHIVGNHTMTHPDMSAITDRDTFREELMGVEALFLEATGKELPKFYRPPQGIYSVENLRMAQDLGYRTVFWSLAYKDWDNSNQPTGDYAIGKLIPRTHNGAVILLHSTSHTNMHVLDALLTRWKALGYRFETIDRLFSR